uniref:Uncharacterized protein n=1 Tax=Anguilla anguilla TaxID=7936 RepID=A0A0E9PCD7_ANGAN
MEVHKNWTSGGDGCCCLAVRTPL